MLVVINFQGHKQELDVELPATMLDIKQMITNKFNIPVNIQSLLHYPPEPENDRSILEQYKSCFARLKTLTGLYAAKTGISTKTSADHQQIRKYLISSQTFRDNDPVKNILVFTHLMKTNLLHNYKT